jgi:DNA repair exonuclease SbcCD ATPase subunit
MTKSVRSLLLLVVLLFATILAEDAAPCNCDIELETAHQAKAELEKSITELSSKIATTSDALAQCSSAAASNEERLTKEQGDLQVKIMSLREEKKALETAAELVVALQDDLADVKSALEQQKAALASAKEISASDAAKQARDMITVKGMADQATADLAAAKAALAELEAKTGGYINFGKIKDDVSKLVRKVTGKAEPEEL